MGHGGDPERGTTPPLPELVATKDWSTTALGQTAQACFPEIWSVIGPMLHGVMATGVATWTEEILALPPDLPLGVTPEAEYRDVEVALPPGSTLLLYTDGLTERRNEPIAISREKLLRRVADMDAAALEPAIDALVDASAADDIAVLALRRPV